jgi:ribosomal protein S18 acetylase RimI-like enzyme
MADPTRSDIQVRLARRADVPVIVRLLADDPIGSTREQPEEPLAQAYWDAFDAITAQGGNEVLVAEAAGEVVGCLQLTVIPGLSRTGMMRGQLEGVRVSARHRGRGIGESLVRAALERARGHGCRLVQLTTDRTRADALRFYEGLGFEASHIGMKLTLG